MTARSRQSVEYFAEEEKHVGMWQTRKVRNSAFWFRGVFHVVGQQKLSLYYSNSCSMEEDMQL